MIATPSQISERDQQRAIMKIQNRNSLSQLERRIQVAIESHNRCLISQLQAEQQFLAKQL
jgi:hypothetical protein